MGLSFISLGLLAGLVLVRTFLGWTLVLEIDGRWLWQREPSPMSSERCRLFTLAESLGGVESLISLADTDDSPPQLQQRCALRLASATL
jgi:hypothetical protein